MNLSNEQKNLLDQLSEEFRKRIRSGDSASIEEYKRLHPELANEIAELFPLISMLDNAGGQLSTYPGAGIPLANGDAKNHCEPGPGSQLGEYRLIQMLGRGGMGVVYQAEHIVLGSEVAIKLLPTQRGRPKLRERFHREASAAARMHHPNIVRVFDFGSVGETLYYVMTLVEGWSLNQMSHDFGGSMIPPIPSSGKHESETHPDFTIVELEKTEVFDIKKIVPASTSATTKIHSERSTASSTIPDRSRPSSSSRSHDSLWKWVARVGVQVADALDYAHSMGVIHRDIKPGNLMIDADDTVYVMDFGLAKVIDGQSLTATGDILGTLRYMPPEAFAGRSDPRGDIYGLGLVLYELLTNRHAFGEVDRGEMIAAIHNGRFARLNSLIPKIPRDLETIVTKSIATEPSDRYSTAAELRDDLTRFINGQPVTARRLTWLYQSGRWIARNRLMSVLAATISVLLMATTISFMVGSLIIEQRDQAVASRHRAENAETAAIKNFERAESAEREVRWRNHLAQAGLIRRHGGIGQRINSVAEIEKATEFIEDHTEESRRELTTELIADLALTDIAVDDGIACPMVDKVDLSSDFKRIAIGGLDGSIVCKRMEDGSHVWSAKGDLTRVVELKFSKDSKFLAVSGDSQTGRRVELWSAAVGERLWTRRCDSYHAFDFVSGKSKMLLAVPKKWLLVDLESGETIVEADKTMSSFLLKVSPDGKQFVHHASNSSPVMFLSLPTFEFISQWQPPTKYFRFAWHPSREEVAVGVDDGSLHIIKPGQAKTYRRLRGQQGLGTDVAFSPDGRKLLSNDWAGRFRLWDYESGRLLLKENINAEPLKFDRTGQQIGVIRDQGQARIGKILESKVFQPLPRESGTVASTSRTAAWHPSGKWAVLNSQAKHEFFDMERYRNLGSVPSFVTQCLIFDDGQLWSRSNQVTCRNVNCNNDIWEIGLPRNQNYPGLQRVDQMAATETYRAFANFNGAILFPKDKSQPPVPLKPHYDCRFLAASPDGQLIATGSHFGKDVRIWRPNGDLVAKLPVAASSNVRFSPNGKWLATSGGGCRIWQVSNWKETEVLGGKMQGETGGFSPDSRVVAYSKRDTSNLFDMETRKEIARLIDPQPMRHSQHLFSPDGSRILCPESGVVWNLREIRKALSQRGMDWDLPPLPIKSNDESRPPIQMVFEQPKQQPIKRKLTPAEASLADYRTMEKAWIAKPNDALAQNNFAWVLVTTQREELRDPKRALTLVSKAVKQDPDNDLYVNTLGVVYYYVGRYRESVERLTSNLNKSPDDGLAFDLYFIAMSYAQLDQTIEAKNHLLMANRWFDQLNSAGKLPDDYVQELKHIRVEAEALIEGVAKVKVEEKSVSQ